MRTVSKCLLLFARGDRLYRELEGLAFETVILIKPGLFFKQLGPRIYQIDPDKPADYGTLLESLESGWSENVEIVHLWNLECDEVDFIYGSIGNRLRSLRHSLTTGPRSLAHLFSALMQSSNDREYKVVFGYYGSGEHLQPQNEIAPRRDDASCRIVLKRLHFEARPADIAGLAAVIDRELDFGASENSLEVGYTGTLLRIADGVFRGKAAEEGVEPLELRRDGSYWITDNSFGWGKVIAEHCQREHGCDITLIGGKEGIDLREFSGSSRLDELSRGVRGIVHCLEVDDLDAEEHNLEATLLIDDASRELPLDFFAFVTPVQGEPAGNGTFGSGFSALREKLRSMNRRHGETRLIHWEGSCAGTLEAVFALRNESQDAEEPGRCVRTSVPQVTKTARRPFFERDVVTIVADTLKLEPGDVDLDAPIDGGRFNSMVLAEFVGRLNKRFEIDLAPPVFYEHKTLRSFIRFLIERYAATPSGTDEVPDRARSPRPSIRTRNSDSRERSAEVAIVGAGGLFPASPNLRMFWRQLAEGKDLISEVPPERWNWESFAGDVSSNGSRGASKWGGFIDDVDAFDASFFEISPREAELMDPQQRLLMEATWQTIEDAGHRPSSLSGSRTGVFVGATTHDYYELLTRSGHLDSHLGTGTSQSILANRLSFLLDVCGPSETIDTACSSSLVAVCRALTAIETGECDGALAGGVNALLSPSLFVALTRAGMLCEDGRCKAFSRDANGYVRGEGAGMIWMKPLHQAEADGDHIYAILKGGAVNHGGRVSSLTVPNPEAQADAIVRCYEKAKIDPATVSYVEAHGSGTELGDPIEINGLKKAFRHLGEKWEKAAPGKPYCGVGTVKSNIGHLESAAGIAGILKVVMALKHRTLPASLHCESVNPYIDLEGSPFYIVNRSEEWREPAGGPRRAGVSSFGFGGVNAHVVLEEASPPPPRCRLPEGQQPALVVLSAKSAERLNACAVDLLEFLDSGELTGEGREICLADLAYTLQVGRDAHSERLGLIVETLDDLREKLSGFIEGRDDGGQIYRGRARRSDETVAIVGRDEDLQHGIDAWMRKGKYPDLLEFWVRGLSVDWNKLYGEEKPQRLSLPTYPFSRERFWLPETPLSPGTAAPASEERSAGLGHLAEMTGRRWFSFSEKWESSPLEIDLDSWTGRIEAKKDHALLVLSENRDDFDAIKAFCGELAEATRRDGEFWEIGFHHLGTGNGPENEEVILEPHLPERDSPLTVFLFLSREIAAGVELRELELVYGCIQSIIRQAATMPVQFYCCYRHESSDPSLYREALTGLFKSAMLETMDHRYRSIAYDAAMTADGGMASCLIKEWLCDDTGGMSPERVPMVRYAGGRRMELQVNERSADEPSIQAPEFRAGATYLMVGALGEIGELICKELGRRFRSRLIIFSRRSEAAAGERLKQIEAAGASVVYRSVDVLDFVALKREMEALKENGETINGVIHMARQVLDAPIFRKSFEEFNEVMAAKVQGTMSVDALTSGEPLEFFITFSSLASLGVKGSPDYAYATAFQNALARRRARLVRRGERSGRFRAICWGQFEKDGGVDPGRFPARLAELTQLGIEAIDASSSIAVMEASLAQDSAVAGFVAVHDEEKFRQAMGFEPGQGLEAIRVPDEIRAFELGETSDREFAEFLRTLSEEDYTDTVRGRVIDVLKRSAPESYPANGGGRWPRGNGSLVPVNGRCANGNGNGAVWEKHPEESSNGGSKLPVSRRLAGHVEKVLKISREALDEAKTFQEYGLDSITAMQLASCLEKEFEIAVQPHWLIDFPLVTSLSGKLSEEMERQKSLP